MSLTSGSQLLIDNDALIKIASMRLFDSFIESCESAPRALTTARFVVRHRLKGMGEADSLSEHVATLVEAVEPTAEDLILAGQIADAASTSSAPVDGGESVLAAIAVSTEGQLITGDKRAIAGLVQIEPFVPELGSLHGRVTCLEQLVLDLLADEVVQDVRPFVCRKPPLDRALFIAFACHSDSVSLVDLAAALESYTEDLRRSAGDFLRA